ncbi:MAG: hypothetical protein J1E35_04170 [Lachnospiraceae bacterium]|nr:hypothetical protein [Lachnospiraceae bacterium]
MRFSEWLYERPDYAAIKNNLADYKKRLLNAFSYEELRDVWLAVKAEVEYMEYKEEIIYIRHLCGINYEESLKEVEIQNLQDPEIYELRDECDLIVRNSPYAEKIKDEFGEMVFWGINSGKPAKNSYSTRLQSKELQLKMQYRQLMASKDPDENALFNIFEQMIETRIELADSMGYKSYTELGYHIQKRYDYGADELFYFRNQVCNFITPVCNEIKQNGIDIDLSYPKAVVTDTKSLISAIISMFKDISDEAGSYIEEVSQKGLYDLELRKNKRRNLFTCCMLPYEKLPFIIGNYTGNGMETGYVVHELGHGFAFYTAARTQPLYEMHRSSPSVNEIHSKTMEHFMYPYLELFVGDKRKEYIRNHLMQQLENMTYRCAIDEFEHTVYDKQRRSKKQICELWIEIRHKYMPWKKYDKKEIEQGVCWPRQTHIVESPFYYIEYDIAQVSTYEFYNKMKDNPKQAWADYMQLCRAGGSKSYLNLLGAANLSNPFLGNTIEKVFRPVIDELCLYTKI